MIDEKKIEKVKVESIMKVKKESINDNYCRNLDLVTDVIDMLGMKYQMHFDDGFGDGASYRIDIVDDRQDKLDIDIKEVIKQSKLDESIRKAILPNEYEIPNEVLFNDDVDGYEYAGLEDDCSYTKGGDHDEA